MKPRRNMNRDNAVRDGRDARGGPFARRRHPHAGSPAEHATRRQLQRPLQPASAQAMPARIRPACEIPAPLPGSRCASSCGASRDGRERQGADHPRRPPRPRPDARTHARGQGILRRAQPAQGQRPARRYCAAPPQQVLSTGELPWTDEAKPRPCAERPRPRRRRRSTGGAWGARDIVGRLGCLLRRTGAASAGYSCATCPAPIRYASGVLSPITPPLITSYQFLDNHMC